jgi:hypothetical protein
MKRWERVAKLMSPLLVMACGGAASGANRPVPPYSGHTADLFDDVIEARAVGLDPEASGSAKGDPVVRERVQLADATVRVRVDTITVKQEETGASYQVGFRVLDKLAGVHPPGETFTVKIDKGGPSAGILRSYETQLVGKRFIAFVRLFAKSDGDREYHFHLSPDSKDVAQAVQQATVLENMAK